jgi:short-chain fatty acids transporter
MGLSSSAAMLMATKSAMPPSLFSISGLIPLTQTLFLWQSIATTLIPGEWLEFSPLLTILVVGLLCCYLIDVFRTSPQGALAALDLNTYNLMFITVGLLLHWRPKRFYA